MSQLNQTTLRDTFWRWVVLILMSSTMFFAYMFVDVLSPLKSLLETQVNWDSTVFGTYGGSEFFLNVFVAFLIFAGIILDKMGIRFTAILSGALMVLGALIKLYALSSYFNNGGYGFELLNKFLVSFPPSAKLACIGFTIFGCGCEMGGVTVSRVLVKWFSGKQLALAMGLEMAIARLGVFAVFQLSTKVSNMFDQSIIMPVALVGLLLCIGLLFYILYSILDSILDKQNGCKENQSSDEETFQFSDLKLIFLNKTFWLVALLCMLYYSAIFPFQKFATEMISNQLGVANDAAASIFSIFPIGAMILTPLLGAFLDYKGKAATMLMLGAVLLTACHLMFAFFPFQEGSLVSKIIMISTISILGVSFSLVPASLWPSVPKLIDKKVLGSAYSTIFWIQNVGLMLVPILIGYVIDLTNADLVKGASKNYTYAMVIFASFGVYAFLIAMVLKIEDKRKGYGLELPNIK